jgi:hypothetical protein
MLAVSLWLVIVACPVAAQTTKLKVAYPTTVGSVAVLWMTKGAKLFERHRLGLCRRIAPIQDRQELCGECDQ